MENDPTGKVFSRCLRLQAVENLIVFFSGYWIGSAGKAYTRRFSTFNG